jgi:hypothetical protein
MTPSSSRTPWPPGALLNHIFAVVRAFFEPADQSDDITVTVTRFR